MPCPFGDWDKSYHQRRVDLGLPARYVARRTREVTRLSQWLSESATECRKASWVWRVGEECTLRALEGWYPLFVTLTVDPSRADAREIMENGDEWRRYRVRMAEVVRKAGGYSQPQQGGPPVSDYFRYFAVVEHGSTREHHHLHALLWLRHVPLDWQHDPNQGRPVPNAREVAGAKHLWPWATVTRCIAFRYAGDAWGRDLGWRWPVDETGRPVPNMEPRQSGAYVSKYLGKEHKEWSHRVKATRRLGLTRIDRLLAVLPATVLLALSKRPATLREAATSTRSTMPTWLVRSLTMRGLISKTWATPAGRKLLRRWMWTRRTFASWPAMSYSVENGQTPWSMDSEQRFAWLGGVCPPERKESFRKVRALWWAAAESLWPPVESVVGTALAGVPNR